MTPILPLVVCAHPLMLRNFVQSRPLLLLSPPHSYLCSSVEWINLNSPPPAALSHSIGESLHTDPTLPPFLLPPIPLPAFPLPPFPSGSPGPTIRLANRPPPPILRHPPPCKQPKKGLVQTQKSSRSCLPIPPAHAPSPLPTGRHNKASTRIAIPDRWAARHLMPHLNTSDCSWKQKTSHWQMHPEEDDALRKMMLLLLFRPKKITVHSIFLLTSSTRSALTCVAFTSLEVKTWLSHCQSGELSSTSTLFPTLSTASVSSWNCPDPLLPCSSKPYSNAVCTYY